MVSSNNDHDVNNNVSSQSLTEETTATKRQQLTTSIGTLTSEPLLPILPFDIVSEIMCRLPVKLLFQLRCLCKSFNSLVSNKKFAKKHLLLSTRRHHLMVSSMNDLGEFTLFDSLIPFNFSAFKFTETKPNFHNSPDSRYSAPLRVCCSCDGILCFTMDAGSFVVLWNPSIKKFNILPRLKNPLEKDNFYLYSFGYDHFIHNYKVIAFSNLVKGKSIGVNVHTLGTDSWRKIQDFPYSCVTFASGIFVSGTVNWLTIDSLKHVIVSLDLEKESYRNLSHPDLEYGHWTLGLVRDCLCIFACTDMFMDVWIMKDYGNIESWTKLYNVPRMGDQGLCDYSGALYISEDDQLLMDFSDLGNYTMKLAVYDSKNVTLKFPEIQNINGWMDMEFYIESLISPYS